MVDRGPHATAPTTALLLGGLEEGAHGAARVDGVAVLRLEVESVGGTGCATAAWGSMGDW